MGKTENIIIRMQGGLGNQLFQLAYGMYLKKIYDAKKIILDIEGFKKYQVRDFELSHFNLDNINTCCGIHSYKYNISRKIYHILQGLKRHISSHEFDIFSWLTQWGLFYAGVNVGKNMYANKFKNIYLYGYFQDVSYVECVRDDLLQKLNIKEPLRMRYMHKRIPDDIYIAVSVRCGADYKKAGYYICDNQYYTNGLDYIFKHVKSEKRKVHIMVFTDDIMEARKIVNQSKYSVEYIKNASPIQQLLIMMDCDHFVISNSSFAWWGAYLSNKSNKIVVAPKHWFPSPKIDTKDSKLTYKNMIIL